MRLAHYLTIGSECSTWFDSFGEKYAILNPWLSSLLLSSKLTEGLIADITKTTTKDILQNLDGTQG